MVGSLHERIHFVLTEPETAANVGAAARALNTMGFQHLDVIAPKCEHLGKEARYVAHASEHFLEQAQVFENFDAMLSSFDMVIGTTADYRHVKTSYLESTKLNSYLSELEESTRIAVVFGRERVGLDNDELNQCDMISSIPMATKHPTLNLGQSVMLYAYIIGQQEEIDRSQRRDRIDAERQEYQQLKTRILDVMQGFKFGERAIEETLARVPHLAGRDVKLLHHLTSHIQKQFSLWKK